MWQSRIESNNIPLRISIALLRSKRCNAVYFRYGWASYALCKLPPLTEVLHTVYFERGNACARNKQRNSVRFLYIITLSHAIFFELYISFQSSLCYHHCSYHSTMYFPPQVAEMLILEFVLMPPTSQVPLWSAHFNQGSTAPLIMEKTHPTPIWSTETPRSPWGKRPPSDSLRGSEKTPPTIIL